MTYNKNFIIHNNSDETVLVDLKGEFHGIVRLNQVGAEMVELLSDGKTSEDIVDIMLSRYDVDRTVLEGDLSRLVSELLRVGALYE